MHSITIPDGLWNSYGGSAMAMRDILYTHAPNRINLTTDNGTAIKAKYRTTCPVCNKKIEKGSDAMMVELGDSSVAVHPEHIVIT